jgi:hypothetical protein
MEINHGYTFEEVSGSNCAIRKLIQKLTGRVITPLGATAFLAELNERG